MAWPRDDTKLGRVRSLMAEQGIDALVVRAPDNVLYLTNFWGMKGYDAVVFPREGDPVLICLEASEADAERTSWAGDLRLFHGYDPADPRPPGLRALDLARQLASDFDRVGIELSLGTQAADRMVGEPTTYPKAWFDAFPEAADAVPLLNAARAIKTEQEVERMRLANEIAAAGRSPRSACENSQSTFTIFHSPLTRARCMRSLQSVIRARTLAALPKISSISISRRRSATGVSLPHPRRVPCTRVIAV